MLSNAPPLPRAAAALQSFPLIKLPKTIRHPGGFTVSGAPVGTFLRSALLIAGQKALGRRFAGHAFFENVERDLALGVMRSHFHHEYPKGTHCCVQCTLAVYPVLEAGAIRLFRLRPAVRAGQADRSRASVAIRPTGECRHGALVARRRRVTLEEALAQLESLGNEKVRAQNKKHGAGDNQFGVRLGDIRKLAKKIKADDPWPPLSGRPGTSTPGSWRSC